MVSFPEPAPESDEPQRREFSDAEWEDLIATIEQGRVVPLIGEGAVTTSPVDAPLFPEVAKTLAAKLKVPRAGLTPGASISDVACAHLANLGLRNQIYTRLHSTLQEKEAAAAPGTALTQLADIEGFNLYLTTTCDRFLEKAIAQTRGGRCDSATFFPSSESKDISGPPASLTAPTVYHLLGRSSIVAGEFVAWEEDLVDFLSELPRSLGTDTMRHLSTVLRNHALLAIGLEFSDWVLRLLLRVVRQGALSQVQQYSWVAEGDSKRPHPATVLFFGSVSRSIQIVECSTPSAFVKELHDRWRARFPKAQAPALQGPPNAPGPAAAPNAAPQAGRGLVFISYAREDEAAAREFERGLRERGCAVYFDRDRLGAAMNFHHELEAQVSEHCAVFVSLISPFTEADKSPSYFRLERNWAAKRLERTAENDRHNFYVPVLIHDVLPRSLQREPSQIKDFQWNHCPRGVVAQGLGERLKQLQADFGGHG